MWLILVGSLLISACAGESTKADKVELARPKRLTQLPHQFAPLPQHQRQQHQLLQQQHQHQQQQQPQYAAAVPPINYRPYNEAPDAIKQILQLQQYREPLVHIPVGPAPQLQPAPAQPQPQLQTLAQPYPPQYAAKPQYGQVPPPQPLYRPQPILPQPPAAYKQPFQQGAYKGIQAARPNPRVPIQPPLNNYTPQYKTQYPQSGPNGLYRPALAGPPPGHAKYPGQPQPYLSQYPKNLPPHLQKIIDSQRSYQG